MSEQRSADEPISSYAESLKPRPRVTVVMPVLINEPWQVHMTEAAVKIMLDTTAIPFELIIAESVTEHCKEFADVHIKCEKANVVKDTNQAIRIAKGEFIVHTGNDIFTKPGWLEALFDCFKIKDCGIATLGSSCMKSKQQPVITEGVFGPFFMMRNNTRQAPPVLHQFDEDYENIFGDTDLILRHYEAGLRSYRNSRVVVTHLYQQTFGPQDGNQKLAERFNKYRQVFYEKHKHNPTYVFRALYEGHVI